MGPFWRHLRCVNSNLQQHCDKKSFIFIASGRSEASWVTETADKKLTMEENPAAATYSIWLGMNSPLKQLILCQLIMLCLHMYFNGDNQQRKYCIIQI